LSLSPSCEGHRCHLGDRYALVYVTACVPASISSRHRCPDRLQCHKCQLVVVQYASSGCPRGGRVSPVFPPRYYRTYSAYTVPQDDLRYLDTNCCPTNKCFYRPFTGFRRAYHQRHAAPAWTGRDISFRAHLLILRWARLSEQIFRVDKWSVCRG
jgi:hypothetical protein